MVYRPEFDLKRPQPGDADLAMAVKRGIEEVRYQCLCHCKCRKTRVFGSTLCADCRNGDHS